ncbi:MAG: hypothetical protein WC680_11120 [Sulfuricurvum sp.]|jgi:hypothetical protein
MNKRVAFRVAASVGIMIGLISNYKIDPIVIIGGILAIVGIILLIGRYLNNKDMKKGYCLSGIDEAQKEKGTSKP